MKVFAVIINEVNDCCEEHYDPILCATKELANQFFSNYVKDAKNDYDEDWIREEDEDSFTTYEDGYYSQNHFDIRIEELEIVEE